MEDGGDDFSKLDHSEVLEFEERSEVLRAVSDHGFQFCQLPLGQLILP